MVSFRQTAHEEADVRFARGLARAFGGAILFGLPLLMTMEMWRLGFYIDRLRLAGFLIAALPLLIGLSYLSGFQDTFDFKQDAVDAFVAYAVAFIAAGAILTLLGLLKPGMSLDEIVGKIALQAVPGSIGALLAQSQLGGNGGRRESRARNGYLPELLLMATGALFLGLNVAPTQEIVVVAHTMTAWHMVALAIVSLIVMHAFVYALGFHGAAKVHPAVPMWSLFLRYTVVGYAVALAVSAYILWTLGRIDGDAPMAALEATLVLAFPSSVGAAAARLIL